MHVNDLVEVNCPKCLKSRTIKWSALKNKSSQVVPYQQQCRSCGGQGAKSEETKAKISLGLTGKAVSEETREKIRLYRKAHPELWATLQPHLGRRSGPKRKRVTDKPSPAPEEKDEK